MTVVTEARLSEAEIETYRQDGLVVPEYRVPEGILAEMQAALDRVIARNPGVDRNVMICPHLTGHGLQGFNGEPIWLEFGRHPAFLDMLEQLVGPDIILWGTTIFGKPAGTGQVIPWHQDAEHWPIKPPATIIIWIALDACTPENGCLRYIPGSHKGPARHVQMAAVEAREAAVGWCWTSAMWTRPRPRDVVLEPGQISIHDTWIVHGSNPNRSARRRAALALRYMPSTSLFDHADGPGFSTRAAADADYTTRPIYLLRGVDRSGNNFEIGH